MVGAQTSAAGVFVSASDVTSAGSITPAEAAVESTGRISASLRSAVGEVEVWWADSRCRLRPSRPRESTLPATS